MIVCVCSNISERQIHQAVNAGLTSMSELRKELGVGAGCGKCRTCAQHVLRDGLTHAKDKRNAAQTMVFHPNAMIA